MNVFRLMERDQYWPVRCWKLISHVWLTACRQGFSVTLLHLWFCWFGSVGNEMLHLPNAKNRERESHLCVNLHRKRLFQLPGKCVKLRFVSCTSTTCWHECSFRKMHKILKDVYFESSKSLVKSKSWNNFLCRVAHVTKLPVFTCMMNVRDHTCLTFVTSFCPCCGCTSKFCHRP